MNEKNQLLISVDAGRSSVKYGIVRKSGISKNIFSSKFGSVDFAYLSTMTAFTFSEKTDMIVSVDDGDPMMIGDTCEKLLPPEKVMYVTDDEIYLQYVSTYILTAIAKLVETDNSDVVLSINLTYNNMARCSEIKEKIKGQHSVKFYNTKGDVIVNKTFTITKLAPFYQGVPSLMYLAIDENLKFDESYRRDGIIIDIGRKTSDVSLMRDFESVKGRSYETATENVFKYIEDYIYEKEKVRFDTMSIEKYVVDNENIVLRNGVTIDIKAVLSKALEFVSEQLRNKVIEDFGKYNSVKWVILTGGGVYYFKEILKNIFSNLIVIDDCIYSNTIGMCYLLQKYEN
ncbi:MAG: hypothetical protein ABSG25_07145 [Bryobacteraceae bacterium]